MAADKCLASFHKGIPCEGMFLPSQGCCERHDRLFKIWFRSYGGKSVYGYKAYDKSKSLRAWRRGKFYAWLDTLTLEKAEGLLRIGRSW